LNYVYHDFEIRGVHIGLHALILSQALRVYIQSKSLSSVRERGEVLVGLEKLIKKTPPLLDQSAIELYDAALKNIFPDSAEEWSKIIGEVFLLRVKAYPKEEEDCIAAFKECLKHEDFHHAQQIANNLEKTFPQKHAYHLWKITTLFYYSQSPKYPETDRNMQGRLAYAMIKKLAFETSKAGVSANHSLEVDKHILSLDRTQKLYQSSLSIHFKSCYCCISLQKYMALLSSD